MPIRNILFFLFVILVLVPGVSLAAPETKAGHQAGFAYLGAEPRYDLSRDLLYLEDPTGRLTLEDVQSPAYGRDFRPFPQAGASYNFGFTRSAYWFRLTLAAAPNQPDGWLWEVGHPNLDQVDLYVAQPGGGYRHAMAGDERPFSSRPYPSRNHVFPVQVQPGQPVAVYLRVSTVGSFVVPVRLWRPVAFLHASRIDYALLSTYFGVLAGMLAYNFLLYFSFRDRAYLVYTAFAASMATLQFLITGLGSQLLWGDHAQWNNRAVHAAIAATSLLAVTFARAFLGSRVHMPILDKALAASQWAWIAFMAAALVLDSHAVVQAMAPFVIVSAIAGTAAGVAAFRQGRPGARFFVLAWGVLFAGVAVFALRDLGVFPSNVLTRNAILLGSAAEMILLAFALADRINVLRRQRGLEEAQRLEEQAERDRARNALAEKSRFLAAMGSDLRGPMHALGESMDRLEGAGLAGGFAATVPDMRSAVVSMHALLDSLLFMARIETGTLQVQRVPVEAGVMLERVRATFGARAVGKGLDFRIRACRGSVRTDPLLLERILNNLASNALRYAESGSVLVCARRRAGGIVFQVWDTGPGIPETHREAVFGEFFRLPRDAGRADSGMGLGLSIVRTCASLMDSAVTLVSRPGQGTCFSVFVPSGGPDEKQCINMVHHGPMDVVPMA